MRQTVASSPFSTSTTPKRTSGAASLRKDVTLTLNPTFVAFTPWTSLEGYVGLSAIWDLDLVANVSPVQYRIRLISAEGSRLLELEEVQDVVGDFDEAALCWTWVPRGPEGRPAPATGDGFRRKPRCGAPRDLRAGVGACRRGTRTEPGAPMGCKTPCPRRRRCARLLQSSSSLSAPPPTESTSMPLNGTVNRPEAR